jgi:glycosyltransferase involved in cell wall biosynthesis
VKNKISQGISLILPVYNEKESLERAVKICTEVLSDDFEDLEIILIDDGSTDGTGEMMDELAKDDGRIRVLHNLVNLNVGISVQRGMSLASKEFVVHNAVDLPLSIEDISKFIGKMQDCDALVLERKTYAGYTSWRWFTSKVNRMLLQLFFGIGGIRDLNFTQVYRQDIIAGILPLAKSPAFTTPEMILRAWRAGLRVKSLKVDYYPRVKGKGAFGRPHDILWSMYDMVRFRLNVWKKLKKDIKY